MKKIFVFSLVLFSVVLIIAGCGKKKKTKVFAQNTIVYDQSLPNNQAMAKYLADCYNNYFKNPHNRFASSIIASDLEKKPAPKDPKKYTEWKKAIGDQWLFAGETDKAIANYEEAMEKVEEAKGAGELIDETRFMLAVAYMRSGEQKNCVANHTAESCILPIQESAFYQIKDPTKKAIEIWKVILKNDPDDLTARFLMNVAYMNLGEYPQNVPSEFVISPEKFKSDYEVGKFPNIAANLGVDFFTRSGGVCVEDFNNDGNLDIVASGWFLDEQIKIMINNGDGTFSDKTNESTLTGITGGLDLKTADYNNDGWMDILIPRGAWWNDFGKLPSSLLRNNGDGTFTDVTMESGLFAHLYPTQSAVFADFNNDGWLDIFFGNETRRDTEKYPCELFISDGKGKFNNVAKEAGADILCFSKGVAAGDYNNDGWMDIAISSQGTENYLLKNETGNNNGKVKFKDVSKEAGIIGPIKSFPIGFLDYNNDGWQDLMILTYDADNCDYDNASEYFDKPVKGEYSILYKNNGNGTFSDVTKELKLQKAMTVMGFNYGDIDNDGWLDMYCGTGTPNYTSLVPKRMFRNNEGKSFQDVTTSGGFGHLQKGHGIGFGDVDNDGDQDVYEDMGGGYEGDAFQGAFYENPGNTSNNWITIKLVGTKANKCAIGSKVKLTLQNPDNSTRDIYLVVSDGGSFGVNSLQLETGLGKAIAVKQIEVTWQGPNEKQVFTDIPMNGFVKLTEGQPAFETMTMNSYKLNKGTPADSTMMHHHHEM
ncbi:MAG: FG-GAP-like repeat-containing protein [Chitinophagales bacterium]